MTLARLSGYTSDAEARVGRARGTKDAGDLRQTAEAEYCIRRFWCGAVGCRIRLPVLDEGAPSDQRGPMDAFLTLMLAIAILITLDMAALRLDRDARKQRA